jgi:AcrR family transcriptional regulator
MYERRKTMPRNKYPEETVQKILEASIELFLEKGYEQTTVLDIVNNMGGLTRGAFYHHFKSKEEVLNTLAEGFFRENNPFEHVKDIKGLTGLEKMKEAFKFSYDIQFREEHRDIAKAILSLLKDPRFLSEQIKSVTDVAAQMVPLIEEGIADGSIKSNNPRILAEFILHQFNLWIIPAVYPCSPAEAFDKVILLKDVFEGIGCPLIDDEMLKMMETIGKDLPFE